MKIALIAKPGSVNTGVGRYAWMLEQSLTAAGVEVERVNPVVPRLPASIYGLLRSARVDLRTFLTNFPIWADYPAADVYHLTSQNLATLLLFRRPKGKVVITVHDIIPYMLGDDPLLSSYRTLADRLFDRIAMAGLKRADALIADSAYTRQCLVDYLGLPAHKITVVHLGIDHERFRPVRATNDVRQRYGLHEDRRYLLYVGSEDPRKNLPLVMRMLAMVRREYPDVALIKVGRPHFENERRRLIDLANDLGMESAIHFLDDVPEHDLPLLYNTADVCITASLYEGFGFPVLEAMACGTPVVCADATSLPELVGDAALLFRHGPEATMLFSNAVARALSDDKLRHTMREKGLSQADAFRWSRTASQVLDLYSV